MNNTLFGKSDESIANLLEQQSSFRLGQLLSLLKVLFKVTIAQLLHNVIVVATFHYIHYLHDILRFQDLHYLYL